MAASAAVRALAASSYVSYEALSFDASRLLVNGKADCLRIPPLWDGFAVPGIATAGWISLTAALQKAEGASDWNLVWIDWYESLRDGRAPWGLPRQVGEQILVEAMLWPQAEWDKGALHINRRIAGLIEAAREAPTGDRKPPSREDAAAPKKAPSNKGAGTRRARTKVGTAAIERGPELLSLCAALTLLVDQRLADLLQSRPNSEAAIEACDREIDHLETTRQQLSVLAAEIEGFRKAATEEARLIAATKSFRSGISAWWQKDHEAICASAARSGLLCLSFGILQTLGVAVSGGVATASLAIVIGGKPIGDALKSMKSVFKG